MATATVESITQDTAQEQYITCSIVDYVFLYSPYYLFSYHSLVMDEMEKIGYKVSAECRDKNYRGKKAEHYNDLEERNIDIPIYKEHDDEYLAECIENLRKKDIKRHKTRTIKLRDI